MIESNYQELDEGVNEKQALKFLDTFRKFYAEFQKIDARGYALDKGAKRSLYQMFSSTVENFFSMKDRRRLNIKDIDGSMMDHPID